MEALYGDVVFAWGIGIETAWADIYFYQFLIWVGIVKIRPYGCVLLIALAIPSVSGETSNKRTSSTSPDNTPP
jgi:hypothetical protein